ncbi:helix-turn-helix domain-containing protein [Neisseria zalophi]|uniref:Helix-turn-helix domain-containing protein n=2 Tax=Neisseria zalophi TaxID=640030 RepID=A0A5J6PU22_9NEIS|nr:helix-turn-helix domain-containing protein [Neisseria zalophi]
MRIETIGERIRKLRKNMNLTQQDLAKKLKDVSHVAVSQWESDTTKPNAENLYELSTLFGCDFGWLLKGGNGEATNAKLIPNLNATQIPILSYDDIQNIDVINPVIPITGEFIMSNLKGSNSTFAFTLKGDSMANDFLEGDTIFIDIAVKPEPGEFVLARVGSDVLFRKYKIDSIGQFSLQPLNLDYPIISSNEAEIKIIGILVEHRIYRRKR